MPHVVQPAEVLYAAYNPIYALASYPVLSREWLSQQTKSEAQLRRENTAMQAELLQAQVRLQNCQSSLPRIHVYAVCSIHHLLLMVVWKLQKSSVLMLIPYDISLLLTGSQQSAQGGADCAG